MAKRVQDKKPAKNKAAKAWIAENVKEQEKRYKAIAKEMDDLTPKRNRWIKDWFKVLTTRGFSVSGDIRRVIKKNELPKPPKRKHKVVF